MMDSIDTKGQTDYFHAANDQHDNTTVLANSDGPGHAPGIMTADSAHNFAELITILLGNLNLLHRQPLNDKGQRQLAWAEEATRQLCNLFNQKQPQPSCLATGLADPKP